ncbi:hypothetical protein [Tunturiibacter gelidoferens]|uniref:Uncharacterized protein n=1 Tax=Tunturiibacter gelidiferens TaxID=3069689 RepID=A0ACC5P1Y3_9BACT|nr:hypothetical protein [Edaphobacter lichenicola]MBB5340864.1 hypothetical protein [Edaphobacter lichenicola]
MAASSAREYSNLLVTGSFRICSDHNLVPQQTGRTWVKRGQALHHFFHDIFGTVDELFHDKANVQRESQAYFPSSYFAGKQRRNPLLRCLRSLDAWHWVKMSKVDEGLRVRIMYSGKGLFRDYTSEYMGI